VISCKDIADTILDYLEDELDPERRARLEVHLNRCPPCINFLKTYQKVTTVSRKVLKDKAPPALFGRVMDFLREELDAASPHTKQERRGEGT